MYISQICKRGFKMKKLFLLILASFLLLTGCKNDDTEVVETTPEQYVAELYGVLANDEAPLNKVYYSYFSKASKDIISLEKYTDMETEKLDGIEIISVTGLSSSIVSDDRYKVTGTMNYTKNGAEKKRVFSEYLIREDGKLKYLYDGIFNRETYIMPEDADTLPIHANYVSIYSGDEYMMIKISVENAGSTACSIGKESLHGAVTVNTDTGSFAGNIEDITKIAREETAEVYCKIKSVSGKPEQVIISHIYSIDFRGEIIDTGNGFGYGVQLVDFVKEETTNEANQ